MTTSNKKVIISLELTEDIKNALRLIAFQQNKSMSAVIRSIIIDRLTVDNIKLSQEGYVNADR